MGKESEHRDKTSGFCGKIEQQQGALQASACRIALCVRVCEERPGSRTQRHLPCGFSIRLKESRREGSKVAARPTVLKRWSSERRSPPGAPRQTRPYARDSCL